MAFYAVAEHGHPRGQGRCRRAMAAPADAIDPVCGMTVRADAGSHPVERDGVTYYFCCVGCRDAFLSTQEA